jgi:uncharacterized protein YdhG (YjbR/CyaY superfamily)
MEEKGQAVQTVEAYIAQFSPDIQMRLIEIRNIIREEAPEAQEKISWQMPTYVQQGNLVHFAAHKLHLGFYPGADGIDAFQEKITGYKSSKGAVQFPYNQPLPAELVREIIRYRIEANKAAAEKKLESKKRSR